MLERTRIRKRKQKGKKKKILKKIFNGVIVILAIMIILFLVNRIAIEFRKSLTGYEFISGSCLWDLARNCPDVMDKREYIQEIKELNAMENDIVYADRLYQVPIY